MELRGQDKDTDMPKSLSYSLARTNQKSSLELSSNIVSTVRNEAGRGRIIFNPTQTLDRLHHHHDHQQQLISLQQQEETQRPARDPNPDPDPVLVASATIAGASNLKTTTPRPPRPPPPPPPQPQPTTLPTNSTASIQYRECLKNHAASMGGHVLDGCGEFMPSGEEGTPAALKCAACDCHRNFHRKEADGESQPGANCYFTYNPNRNIGHRTTIYSAQATPSLPPPPPEHHHKYSHGFCHGLSTSQSAGLIPQAMMAAFGGNSRAPAESSSEDLNIFHSNAGEQQLAQPSFSQSKKRFRTKFTQEQKDGMQEFAEKLEWKIQKQDEQEVQQFCSEVGVKRKAFKVWINNNKQAMKKKQL